MSMTVFISSEFDCRKARGPCVPIEEPQWNALVELVEPASMPVLAKLSSYYDGYFVPPNEIPDFRDQVAAVLSKAATPALKRTLERLGEQAAVASLQHQGLLFCCD